MGQWTAQSGPRSSRGAGAPGGSGATEQDKKLKQYLEDERIALFLQNEEFMRELQRNREFLIALERGTEAAAPSSPSAAHSTAGIHFVHSVFRFTVSFLSLAVEVEPKSLQLCYAHDWSSRLKYAFLNAISCPSPRQTLHFTLKSAFLLSRNPNVPLGDQGETLVCRFLSSSPINFIHV